MSFALPLSQIQTALATRIKAALSWSDADVTARAIYDSDLDFGRMQGLDQAQPDYLLIIWGEDRPGDNWAATVRTVYQPIYFYYLTLVDDANPDAYVAAHGAKMAALIRQFQINHVWSGVDSMAYVETEGPIRDHGYYKLLRQMGWESTKVTATLQFAYADDD